MSHTVASNIRGYEKLHWLYRPKMKQVSVFILMHALCFNDLFIFTKLKNEKLIMYFEKP